MLQINLESWADGIKAYLLKYMYNEKYAQSVKDTDYKEFLKYRRICDDELNELIETLRTIKYHTLTPYEDNIKYIT